MHSSLLKQWAELILEPFRDFTYVTAHSPTLPLLHLHHSSFSNPSFPSPTSQALRLRHMASSTCIHLSSSNEQSSFSNLSVTSRTSQLILQPFRRFTYVTAYSPTLPLLHLRHSSFSNPSFPSPTSQALRLRHLASRTCIHLSSSNEQSSFSNLSVTSRKSQLILQSFRRFTYVTAHSPTLPLLHLGHSSFSNLSFASPTSETLHLRHLASRPWMNEERYASYWVCNCPKKVDMISIIMMAK